MRITTLLLAALLALAGSAGATPSCPECDEDGAPNADNDYHSVDAGGVTNEGGALADGDAAYHMEKSGFFAWLSLCLSAWLDRVEETLGLDSGLDGNAEVYASESGVDVDATVRLDGEVLADFDQSELGSLDGTTWEVVGEADAQLDAAGAPAREYPEQPAEVETLDVDACVTGELTVAACG